MVGEKSRNNPKYILGSPDKIHDENKFGDTLHIYLNRNLYSSEVGERLKLLFRDVRLFFGSSKCHEDTVSKEPHRHEWTLCQDVFLFSLLCCVSAL